MNNTYANMTWQPRWNNAEQVSALSQSGSSVILVTAMGTIRFDLTDSKSVAAYCCQMRSAIDLLEKTIAEYDQTWSNFTKGA